MAFLPDLYFSKTVVQLHSCLHQSHNMSIISILQHCTITNSTDKKTIFTKVFIGKMDQVYTNGQPLLKLSRIQLKSNFHFKPIQSFNGPNNV